MPAEPAFILGMITATLLHWTWRWHGRRTAAAATIAATSRGLGGTDAAELRVQTSLLVEENGSLKALVNRAEERIAVLERIATDRTASLDHEIERLRDR